MTASNSIPDPLAREPMKPIEGLKRVSRVPTPTPRPQTKRPIPPPVEQPSEPEQPTTVTATPAIKPTPDTTETTPRSVFVPVEVATAWRAAATRLRKSQVEVLTDAIEAQHAHLDEIVANAAPTVRTVGELFPTEETVSEGPKTSMTLRFKVAHLDTIDALAARHNADSRSHFIAAVLAAELLKK